MKQWTRGRGLWAVNIKDNRGPEFWPKAIPFFWPLCARGVYIVTPPPPDLTPQGIGEYQPMSFGGKYAKGE